MMDTATLIDDHAAPIDADFLGGCLAFTDGIKIPATRELMESACQACGAPVGDHKYVQSQAHMEA